MEWIDSVESFFDSVDQDLLRGSVDLLKILHRLFVSERLKLPFGEALSIAFLFDLASFQFKSRMTTLLFFFSAASLIAVHFFLLGAITAAVIGVLAALRFLVSIFTTNRYVMYVFLVLLCGVLSWKEKH